MKLPSLLMLSALLVVWILAPDSRAQTNTAAVTAHSRSLSLGEFQGTHPEFGLLIHYVTTYDGATGTPLLEWFADDFYNSEELSPLPGQPLPTLYRTDYVVLSDDELVSYGEISLNLPSTDADVNGLPDFLQFDKAVDFTFTGSGRPDFRAEGVPLNSFTISNGRMRRPARGLSGEYWMTLVEPEPMGTVSYEGLFTLAFADGEAEYSRGEPNQLSLDLLAQDRESRLTAETSFTVISPDEVRLPDFIFHSPEGPMQAQAVTLIRDGNSYRGNMRLADGDLNTSWADYTEWLLEITDPNDFDFDGIPDFSDELPPANRPPTVTLTAPTEDSSFAAPSVILLVAEADDPDGDLQKVEFYADNVKLGEETAARFSYLWSGVAAGAYTLIARAIDWHGAVTDSAPVAVTVRQPAPGGVLFSTGFEKEEGYQTGVSLVGQRGWTGTHASMDSGVIAGIVPSEGQCGYLGLHPPDSSMDWISIGQSVNFDALATEKRFLACSALLQVAPSSNGNVNDFYWTIYGANEDHLLSLVFASGSSIRYTLYNGQFRGTQQSVPTGWFLLEIVMDMDRNQWSASVDGTEIISDQPMARYPARLSMGSIRAEWAVPPEWAGDNYLLFDQIRLTASAGPGRSVTLLIEPVSPSLLRLRAHGEPEHAYVLESSDDLISWVHVGEPVVAQADGEALFPDVPFTGATTFYRCAEGD